MKKAFIIFFLFFLISCQKEQNYHFENIPFYQGDKIKQKIESLRIKYNYNFDIEYDSNIAFSEYSFKELEKLLSQISNFNNYCPGTKIAEEYEGDESELLIICLDSYTSPGGIGMNDYGYTSNDITDYRISSTIGYHQNGDRPSTITHRENCRYLYVSFYASYWPFAGIEFNGTIEYNYKQDNVNWVDDNIVPRYGLWDWQPGNFYYFYNDVALVSEYLGTKKSIITDIITGGVFTIRIRERFIFIIYDIAGDPITYDKRSLRMRGYFVSE